MLVVIAVIAGVGATVLTTVQSTQTSGTFAYNATGYGLSSVNQLSSWLPTIAIVLALATIISVLGYLMLRQG